MLRVRVQWTGVEGAPFLSTFYFAGDSALDAQEAADAVRAFLVAIGTTRRSDLTGQVESEVVRVNPGTGVADAVFPVTSASFIGGGNSTSALPLTTQALLRLRTGTYVGGREIRGRIFLPGYTEEDSTSGKPTATLISTINTNALGTLFSQEPGNELVVWSRTKGQESNVTTATAWTQFASLRSRRD